MIRIANMADQFPWDMMINDGFADMLDIPRNWNKRRNLMADTGTILMWNTRPVAEINRISGSGTGLPSLSGGDIEVKGFLFKEHHKGFQSLSKDFLSGNKGRISITCPNPVKDEWKVEALIKGIEMGVTTPINLRPITIHFAITGKPQLGYLNTN